MQLVSTILALCCAVLLSACGGGGASSTPPDVPVVTVTFPLQAAYGARVSAGYSDEFVVSGACSGTATLAAAKATASLFEAVAGFVSAQTSQVSLTDCAPANNVVTGNTYFDAKFTPIGSTIGATLATQEYAKFASAPAELPVSVKAGDAGSLLSQNTFTSSSKLVPTGRRTLGYGVEFDTASTAIVVLTSRAYNAGDQLLSTQVSRYLLDTAGTLTMLSIDVQYSTTSTQKLRYTVKRAVSASTSFALRSAYQARLAAGGTDNFTVSGTCSGTAALVATVPSNVTFEGQAGLSVTETNTLQLSTCSPPTLVLTDVTYFDSNYSPIGAEQPGIEFARFRAAATPLPAMVKVGDTGTIVSLDTLNAAKTALTGRRDISYVVEADTATTALVNIINRSFNASGQLLLMQQSRYRMDAAGTLVLVSIDAQYSTTSTVRLVYTSTRPFVGSQKFPLQQAYKARWLVGSSDRFVVSGTCNGTATLTESAPIASNFEGTSVFATNQTALLNLTDCTPGTNAIAATAYYDTNAALLGVATPGFQYAKALGASSGWPTQVQIGDAGSVVTVTTYTDNTKAVATGRKVVTYVIEPEALPAATTAIVNVITRTYNVSDQLLSTEQSRYRIDGEGNLKVVSVDVQNSTTSTARLLYTLAQGAFTLVPAWPL